ncbi:hypothetical protein B0H13DRAFT_2313643 [Mycena leptocephala]|nr:hypothetical protein B0H13DRAFT_2313643 [Mycena leptocephala]
MAVRATIGPDSSHAYALSSISGPVLAIVNATYLTLAPHSPIALFIGFHLSFHHGRPSATHPSPSLSCSPHPRTFHRIRTLSPQSGIEDALASTTESSTGTMSGPRSTGVTYRASPGCPAATSFDYTAADVYSPRDTVVAKMHEIPLPVTKIGLS